MRSPNKTTNNNVNLFNPKVKRANVASPELQDYVSKKLGKEIPIELITGLSNVNGRMPITSNNRYLQTLTNPNGYINTSKLLTSLKT